jgi:glycosyltransferase involved in cell wall biosynthesis
MAVYRKYNWRVGIDAHVLDGKPQGSATFLINILKCIAEIETSFQLVIYSSDANHINELVGKNTFEFHTIPRVSSARRLLNIFPTILTDDLIDLGVFQFISPPFSGTPSLIVVHDVLPFTHPDLFPLGFRISRQILFRHSLKRACSVVTVSETAKSEICRLFPDVGRSCTVVTNGPSFAIDSYFDNYTDKSSELPPSIGSYILAVGRIEKRKNIDLLTRAFLRVRPEGVKLIIVGNQDLGFKWHLPDDGSVIHLHNISNDQLLRLYHGASLFVFPSRAEGFGIPLLDSLLAGIPSISSNQTAMPEIASNLAQLFDPTAPDAESILAGYISSHFRDHSIAPPTLEQRQRLAQRFNWGQSAQTLVNCIESALRKNTM